MKIEVKTKKVRLPLVIHVNSINQCIILFFFFPISLTILLFDYKNRVTYLCCKLRYKRNIITKFMGLIFISMYSSQKNLIQNKAWFNIYALDCF